MTCCVELPPDDLLRGWLEVEGDLDDFIFYGDSSAPSEK